MLLASVNYLFNKSIAVVQLLRPHQWIKNGLIFAPLLFSGQWSTPLFEASLVAFVAFCLISSASYCLNDAADQERDRQHPVKRMRPVASGAVTTTEAYLLAAVLTSCSLALAAALGRPLTLTVATYFALQISYTFLIKNIPILDLLLLSSLYVLRIVAGVAATAIHPSTWIITCTSLIALMLAAGKRYLEVSRSGPHGHHTRPVLGKYSHHFLRHLMSSIGAATLVCYLLWCQETVESGRFSVMQVFPSALPVTFCLLRYQLLVYQKQFDEDPAKGLLQDAQILAAVLLYVGYIAYVIY